MSRRGEGEGVLHAACRAAAPLCVVFARGVAFCHVGIACPVRPLSLFSRCCRSARTTERLREFTTRCSAT